jgi:Fis family transcriptional regulator
VKSAALLLSDAHELERACAAAGLEIVRVGTAAEGRRLLARERFALVDGRIAAPRPLDEELGDRIDAFYRRLGAGRAAAPRGEAARAESTRLGLYDAVMREVERPLIAGALARANGVRATAAAALGIDRGTLARRLRALGLDGT